ncbi:hypothetical protein COHA_008572 [Chlorella ohadii]|uniref:Uncharacterized protein n=1 Tax=Chlorella ohadii TaxID=2649997 RepID=A0AAD5DGE2_9CHLO|nr:hypothetical protein COHA_008572 [Chlorella ohadii]
MQRPLLDEQGLLSIDAGQAALLDLLQPAAPLLPPDAEHRRRVLRAVVLAAEADGQEVDERLMQLLSDCLLAQPPTDGDAANSGGCSTDSSLAQALLPPPPQPGWCYKLWSYGPVGEAPAASLAAVASLERAVAAQRQAWLAKHKHDLQQGQRQQLGALPACPPAATGDGSHGLLALHVSLNLLEGGTGCHEWEAGFFLAEWVLNNAALIAGRACLEIGCGAGMVGVALHRAGAAHVLCTDGDSQTVVNCRFNLQLNGVPLANSTCSCGDSTCGRTGHGGSSSSSSSSEGMGRHPRHATAECRQLCWEDGWPGTLGADEELQQVPTVVLGADLLYDPTVIPTLLSLLKQVLTAAAAAATAAAAGSCSGEQQGQQQGQDRRQQEDAQQAQQQQQQPAAYLATTLRNEATLHQFLAAVEADPSICMQQLAGPPVPDASGGSSSAAMLGSQEKGDEPPAGKAHAAADVAALSAAGGPDGNGTIRWQHVPELDAARERIFLHRISLAARHTC